MKSKTSTALIVLLPILLIGLSVGGFFAYQEISAQHQANKEELERFGYEMVGKADQFEKTKGELGAVQLPTTFEEGELTPTHKVIKSLMRDKESLLSENTALEQQIYGLNKRIAELEKYKALNERFAPKKLSEERRQVEHALKAFLIRSSDTERFSTMQIEIMAAAGAAEYQTYVTRNQLMITEDKKQNIINNFLPAYAFCVGDAVDVAANSRSEERLLAAFFRTDDSSKLPSALNQDLSIVLTPCQQDLRTKMQEKLSPGDS